jgi:hypothetical protein
MVGDREGVKDCVGTCVGVWVGEENASVLVEKSAVDVIRTERVVGGDNVVWTKGSFDVLAGLQAVKLNPDSIIKIMMEGFMSSIKKSFPAAEDIFQPL